MKPLFFLPASDGAGHVYRHLADRLDARWSVMALQTPGLLEGQTALSSMDTLGDFFADQIADQLEAEGGEEGYCLAGWSFGAIAAVETARNLITRNLAPKGLALIDPSPWGAFAQTGADPLAALRMQVEETQAPIPDEFGDPDAWTELDPKMRRSLWAEVMRQNGLFPNDQGETGELAARFENMMRAHLKALVAYDAATEKGVRVPSIPLVWASAAERPKQWRDMPNHWNNDKPQKIITGDHWGMLRDAEAVRQLAAMIDIAFV